MASLPSAVPSHDRHLHLRPPSRSLAEESSSEEEEGPLFNPSGLSSSSSRLTYSVDARFDPSSHAAARLGLSPHSPSQQSLGRYSAADTTLTSAAVCLLEGRGRRRRSSELAAVLNPSPPPMPAPTTSEFPVDGLPPSSEESQQWWKRRQRPQNLSVDLSAVQIDKSTAVDSRRDHSPSPSSASVRSQAAEFLSSFSNAAPPSVIHSRQASAQTMSTSYKRPLSMARDSSDRSRAPSAQSVRTDMSSSWHALDSSVASLVAHKVPHANGQPATDEASQLRPEEEGYRFGPGRRYTMGKLIGFGGFSTIREGWEASEERIMGEGAKAEASSISPHRVAIKISYKELGATTGDELNIWRHLPSHPNILPLLHDERVVVDRPVSSITSPRGSTATPAALCSHDKQEVELLVMPYCEGGNLMSFIRTEGGTKANASPASSHSRRTSIKRNVDSASHSMYGGSAFVPSSSSIADRLVSSGSSFTAPRSSSSTQRAFSQSSTGLQRALSTAATRSRGVSIQTAREVTRQLAEGLLCLHTRAHVLHGDLKLENVLGQPKRARRARAGSTEDHDASSTDTASNQPNAEACWRLADFGLSQNLSEDAKRPALHERPASWLHAAVDADHTRNVSGRSRQPTAGLTGGSIAYTPPERWQDRSDEANSSPGFLRSAAAPSLFAPDMWALGCIVYALLSGKLPFNDPFEPRLQAKIAKGDWDFPPRLWRRARRILSDASKFEPDYAHRSRSIGHKISGEYSSLPRSTEIERREASHRSSGYFGMEDMSASLPSLPPLKPSGYTPLHHGTASAHEAPIVGSVPTKMGEYSRFDIDVVAQAAADAEVDPESDEDEGIDQSWDGRSGERAAAREVLRGLLAVDPCERWTVDQLVVCRWLHDATQSDRSNVLEGHEKHGQTASAQPRRTLHDVHEESTWTHAAEVPTRPQWARQRSWRAELTFERVDQAAVQRRQRRDSSLTRSRPASRSRAEDNREGVSRSISRHRSSDDCKAADADSSVVLRSGTASPYQTPSSPSMETRGRRPRTTTRIDRDHEEGTRLFNSSIASSRSRPIPIASPSTPASRSQSMSRVFSRSTNRLSKGGGEEGSDDDSIAAWHKRSHSRPPLLTSVSREDSSLSSRGRTKRSSTSGSRTSGPPSASERSSPAFMEATRATSTRSSTSRSRSRAPEALAQALRGSGRSASRSAAVDVVRTGTRVGTPADATTLRSQDDISRGVEEQVHSAAQHAKRDEEANTETSRGRRDRCR